MHQSRALLLAAVAALLLSTCPSGVHSQGLMGGFKGHHHRGSGAVELLLATGILAKLLNHRARHGPSPVGRHILHSLIGGARYPPRFGAQGRYPLDLGHAGLFQEDLIDPQASMVFPLADELMLNQESAILGAKSPLLMAPSFPMIPDQQLLAEAQISQQLIAARRARKLLEARKMLAAQEAKQLLMAQSQAAHQLLAAQEAAQAASLLAPTRLFPSASSPQHRMVNQQQSSGQQQHQHQVQQQQAQQHQAQQQAEMMNSMMNAERRMSLGPSDTTHTRQRIILPPGVTDAETANIISQLRL